MTIYILRIYHILKTVKQMLGHTVLMLSYQSSNQQLLPTQNQYMTRTEEQSP